MRIILENLVQRWKERRARRLDRKTGSGVNIPIQLSEFQKRAAYERVRQELKDRRGRW